MKGRSRLSESRFLQGWLFDFSLRIWTGWLASQSRSGPRSRFFSCFVQIFYVFPCTVELLYPRKQHDLTKACCSKSAVSAMAASRGRWCPPPQLSLCDWKRSPPSVVAASVVVTLPLFLLLPSSLSLSLFGVIIATVVAITAIAPVVAVILVAPVTVALAAFVVAHTVVATTFLAVDVALVFDCDVPSALQAYKV